MADNDSFYTIVQFAIFENLFIKSTPELHEKLIQACRVMSSLTGRDVAVDGKCDRAGLQRELLLSSCSGMVGDKVIATSPENENEQFITTFVDDAVIEIAALKTKGISARKRLYREFHKTLVALHVGTKSTKKSEK